MSLPQPDVRPVQLVSAFIANTFTGPVGTFLDTRGYSCFDLFFQVTGAGTVLRLIWLASYDGSLAALSVAPVPILSDATGGEFDLEARYRVNVPTPSPPGPGLRTFWIPNLPAIGMGGQAFLETTGNLTVTIHAIRKVVPAGPGLAGFLVP